MCRLLNVLLALLSRFLFAVHGVVTVWRVVAVKGEPLYWLLLTGVALLGVEMAVTLRCTRHGIVELDPENWVAGLEQTMLIVLVLGRWLMPKGDMSRDQLSQLLMVYVGLGADILDIFDTFKEPEVKTNQVVVILGLALFSWALMQFPLVLTQTRPTKDEPPQRRMGALLCCPEAPPSFASCCSSEVWSLLLTVGLQDGPFLLYRIYLMVQEQVLNQLMIFFTCKNILIVLLEFYRIFVVQCKQKVGDSGLERCAALMLRCQNQEGNEEEEEEEAGAEECCGEQSCHIDMDKGTEREEDQRGVQVKKGSKCREA
uniref:Transmembrane protein 26b n=1 Tax=Stegastes partitus TaxID=144197 RepID=A0A3B5AKS6_9TELE